MKHSDMIINAAGRRVPQYVNGIPVVGYKGPGQHLPEGKKSYAVSFTLQDEEGTLTDKQIDRIMQKLQERFKEELGAKLR